MVGDPSSRNKLRPRITCEDIEQSYGNAIALTDTARTMVFQTMRLDDEAMATWFTLLTRLAQDEIDQLLAGHPREAKARLCVEIATFFHDAEAAAAFDREVRDKALPEDIAEHAWPKPGESLPLPNLLVALGLVNSSSDGRRMIQQGAVKIDGEAQTDVRAEFSATESKRLFQVGKKRFAYLLG